MKKEEVIEILNKQIDMYQHTIDLSKKFIAGSSGATERFNRTVAECEAAISALEFVRDEKIKSFDDRTDDPETNHAELVNTYVKERIENDIGLGVGVKQRILEFFDEAESVLKKPSTTDDTTHDYIIVKHTIKAIGGGPYKSTIVSKENVGILADVTASKAIKVLEEVEQRESDSHVQYSLERLDQ